MSNFFKDFKYSDSDDSDDDSNNDGKKLVQVGGSHQLNCSATDSSEVLPFNTSISSNKDVNKLTVLQNKFDELKKKRASCNLNDDVVQGTSSSVNEETINVDDSCRNNDKLVTDINMHMSQSYTILTEKNEQRIKQLDRDLEIALKNEEFKLSEDLSDQIEKERFKEQVKGALAAKKYLDTKAKQKRGKYKKKLKWTFDHKERWETKDKQSKIVNMSYNNHKNYNRVGFSLKKDSLSNSKAPAFERNAAPKPEVNLPKLHTDENEKKYLQSSGANYTEEDLYDPLNPTDEHELEDAPKPKKKRKKTRWDVDDEILPTRPIDEPPKKIYQPPMGMDMSCMYQKAEGSPEPAGKKEDEYSDEDELDKYMAGVEDTLEKEEQERKVNKKKTKEEKRLDLDEEDDQESYYNARKDLPLMPYPDEDDEIEYDSDGNPIPPEKSKIIIPLPPIDHSEVDYVAFESNFYEEHPDIAKLTKQEVHDIKATFDIKVSGAEPARPIISFAHFGFDNHMMASIRKSEYSKPTVIQSQAVPVALSGRDIIGIAKTGSGKTAAFIWPMLVHIMGQGEIKQGDGPIGLICAPTRELCQQIHTECKRFGKCYNLRAVACYGGGSKWEQTKALQQGAEIVVATPGRLTDLIKAKATNLTRVTYLVFDEADRMFDLGFEPQVRAIANNVRPDRQCLLFSATMKKKIEWLCRDILTDPIRIVIGELGEANEDVVQAVEVMKNGKEKWDWLMSHLVEFTSGGSVLIFVTKKTNCEEVAKNLKENGFELGLMHGDFDQYERNVILKQFKQKEYPILVATDVAARGLDIPSIKTVINYDVARDITTHTHRIGRTGRAGMKGIAYTLITAYDTHFSADLVRNLESANQRVPEDLLELAMKNPWFRKTRARRTKKAANKEFMPRDRPGFGLDETPGGNEETSIEEEEELFVGGSSGKRPSRSLLTSYSMSASAFGTSRLANLKTAFKSGYNRFSKATESSSQTMDYGVKGAKVQTFDPADQPKAMQQYDR